MRNLTKVVAAALALTMAMGMMVGAATSSTTSNTTTSSETSSSSSKSETIVYPDYIVYRNSAVVSSRAAAVKTGAGVIRVASDYKAVTDDKIIATAIALDANTAAAIKAILPAGGTVVGPIKVQFYKKGVAGQTGFGTFYANVSVSTKYNGQTATVYIYNQDGTTSTVTATVTAGRVSVPLTQGATIAIVL